MVMIKAISDAGSTSTEMKKTKGKRKIDIKFIKDDNSRLVTFTKRRTGLFKKAAEICVLTGAEIAVIVSSPGDRISYAFRHPNDVVIDRYLNNTNKDATTTQNSPPPLPMKEFNQHYVEVSKEVEAEKKRRESIPVNVGGIRWYDEAVDGLEVEELQGYLSSLAELKKKVLIRADELLTINKSSKFFGSNLSQLMEWNNGSQPVNVPTNGGFNFQDGGDNGNFSSIPASFVFN